MDILCLVARIVVGHRELHRGLQQDAADQVGARQLFQYVLTVFLGLFGTLIRDAADVVDQHVACEYPQTVDAHLIENAADGVHADAIGLKHGDVAPMLLGSFVDIEIVLEESSSGVDDAVEEFLPRCVHQDIASLRPFGLRVDHLACFLCLYCQAAKYKDSGQHPSVHLFHRVC